MRDIYRSSLTSMAFRFQTPSHLTISPEPASPQHQPPIHVSLVSLPSQPKSSSPTSRPTPTSTPASARATPPETTQWVTSQVPAESQEQAERSQERRKLERGVVRLVSRDLDMAAVVRVVGREGRCLRWKIWAWRLGNMALTSSEESFTDKVSPRRIDRMRLNGVRRRRSWHARNCS